MRNKTGIAIIVASVMTLIFSVYVWPTAYRYDHTTIDGADYSVRTNRFTDDVYVLTQWGWIHPKPENRPPSDLIYLTDEQAAKLLKK